MIGAERLCTKVHIRYTSALWMFGLLGMGCSDWVAKDTGAYDLLGLSTTSTSEPCIPQTECVDLQPVQAFNAVVLNGAYATDGTHGSGTAVEGGIAARTVILDSFNVGAGRAKTPIAVVGRDAISLKSGQVFGDVVSQGGTLEVEDVGFMEGSGTRVENLSFPFDFEAAAVTLARTSKLLANQPPNGAVRDLFGKGLGLSGTNPEQIVFRILEEQVDKITDRGLQLDVPATAMVVINVFGETPRLANHDQVASAGRVLWNFPEATELTLDSVWFEGSVLAPHANLYYGNSSLEGTVVASTMDSRGTLYEVPLEGCFLVDTCVGGGVP
jgi:choice-of-anchor A domain-containing protein